MEIKVRVKREDIAAGCVDAGYTCGCPIWHALNRELRLGLSVSDEVLSVPSVTTAKIGKIKIPLSLEAIQFQKTLMKDADAPVRPFSFETSF